MTIFRLILPLTFFLLFSSAATAQQTGDSVFRFLELSGDARSAALGGAHAAFIEPQSSQFISNPANLSRSKTDELHLSYLNHLGDISFGTASYAFSIPGYGTASASIRFLNYGNMTGYDQFGNETGSAAANDLALTAGFSDQLSESLSYGVSVTGIYSSLAGYQSSAVSLSGGLLYNFADRETSIGLYLNNAGTQLSTYNGISEPLPLNIAAGVVHRFEYLPVRLHLTLQRLNNWNLDNPNDVEDPSFFQNLSRHVLGGAEFLFGERITGRIGYDYWLHGQTQTGKRIDGAGLSFGVGIHLNRMDIDFSRTSFSDMGSVVQLGIGLPIRQFL
ncbi:hypothetical protein DYD21_04595 [Rhodohalobacter sp. SW132]|uniref:type IX secretion system protein PorQ n=1 Tax=Rhodohalobacter sp. SW132 TaxID=2293433 RepID=UPI000E260B44|nr:type IX secretion system protein PorQ [Rhodohalobacter sp. SW132]REL39239.1 hypothetical protein DYD21_04595 [Rhodohalobacter sp. SW132]